MENYLRELLSIPEKHRQDNLSLARALPIVTASPRAVNSHRQTFPKGHSHGPRRSLQPHVFLALVIILRVTTQRLTFLLLFGQTILFLQPRNRRVG
jgi:hypothetical protein